METGPVYFRKIPYLDATRAGDHKVIWELNRHQHLVLLAQAFHFEHDQRNLDTIFQQLCSWMDANPFQRGINWVSALEVAFRTLSWLWLEHLVGAHFEPSARSRFLETLYWHGLHLENNLSVYFSPNTHLLGEAVALHALGSLLPWLPNAARWRQHGAAVVREQMLAQVMDDGAHFEQSTYYHVYALDMFLFHSLLEDPGADYLHRLERMTEYLAALLGPARELAFLGDDDGGRFFHPYGRHTRYGRATLAASGVRLRRPDWIHAEEDLFPYAFWWLGPHRTWHKPIPPDAVSRCFESSGIAVLCSGDRHILFDGGHFGTARAGHSHSDTLSLVVRAGEKEILIDPGTYSYMDPTWREIFRRSAAHNTIRVDGRDQAIPLTPFAWLEKPVVSWRGWNSSGTQDIADVQCAYGEFVHRRRLWFLKPDLLFIVDEVNGPPGEHLIEQFWHLGSLQARGNIVLSGPATLLEHDELAWRSQALASKTPAPVLKRCLHSTLPCRLAAAILLRDGQACTIQETPSGANFYVEGIGAPFVLELP